MSEGLPIGPCVREVPDFLASWRVGRGRMPDRHVPRYKDHLAVMLPRFDDPPVSARATPRRSPPDYTDRRTKLRLFGYVAVLMLVLGLLERLGNPLAWQWMWQQDPAPQAPAETDGAPRPAAAAPGESGNSADGKASRRSPLDAAWADAWQTIVSQLNPAEKHLLLEQLQAPSRRGPGNALPALPAGTLADSPAVAERDPRPVEVLLGRLTVLWQDYHAKAASALDERPDAEKSLWLKVLAEADERFTSQLLPALRARMEEQLLTEAQQRELQQLAPLVIAEAAKAVQDDTVFRPAERDVWFALLSQVQNLPLAEARLQAAPVTYLQLAREPQTYRGRLVKLEGTVRRAYRERATDNRLGIREYIVLWLQPEGNGAAPIAVYCLQTPFGFPRIADKDSGEPTKLREDVRLAGVFFKRWAYASHEGLSTAPLVLAGTFEWIRPVAWPAPAPWGVQEQVIAVAATLLLSLALTAIVWKLTGRKRNDHFDPAASKAFDPRNLQIGPTTQQALAALEREARGPTEP